MIETYCRLQYNTVPNIQAKGQLFSTAHANQIGFSSSLLAPRSDFDIRDIAGFTGSFFLRQMTKNRDKSGKKSGSRDIGQNWKKFGTIPIFSGRLATLQNPVVPTVETMKQKFLV